MIGKKFELPLDRALPDDSWTVARAVEYARMSRRTYRLGFVSAARCELAPEKSRVVMSTGRDVRQRPTCVVAGGAGG